MNKNSKIQIILYNLLIWIITIIVLYKIRLQRIKIRYCNKNIVVKQKIII